MVQKYRPRLYPQKDTDSYKSPSGNRFLIFIVFLGISVSAWFLLDFNPRQSLQLQYRIMLNSGVKDTLTYLSDSTFIVRLPDPASIRIWKSNMELHTFVINDNELSGKKGKVNMHQLLSDRIGAEKKLHFTVKPAYIRFHKTPLASRKVNIDVSGAIHTDNAWSYLYPPVPSPAGIRIYGNPKVIDTITAVRLKEVPIVHKEGKQTQTTGIVLPEGVKADRNQIRLTYTAGRFINKEAIVSIDKNSYDNKHIRLLPGQVKIHYRLPLKAVKSFSEAQIILGVDTTHLNRRRVLPVVVFQKPEYLNILQIEPDSLDFVLLKVSQ